jgi:tetratricopeptide (TPR) repeat protein
MAGRLWVVVLVLLAVWCGPAGAQTEIPEELQELRSELFKLFSEGDGQGAVATAQDALATAKRGLEPHLRAEVGEWLAEFAILHARRGELAEAAPYVKGAVAIMEGAYGADQPVFADFLLRLAGRYAAPLNKARGDADPLVARALAVYEQVLAPDDGRLRRLLFNYAYGYYYSRYRYAEAVPLYEKSLALFEKATNPLAFPEMSWETVMLFSNLEHLGSLYQARGRYADAERLYRRARDLREWVAGPAITVHKDLPRLAGLYSEQGHFSDALALYKRIYKIDERSPPQAPAVVRVLAGVYGAQGRVAEAEALYRQTIERLEATHTALEPGVTAEIAPSTRRSGCCPRTIGRSVAKLSNRSPRRGPACRPCCPRGPRSPPSAATLAHSIAARAGRRRRRPSWSVPWRCSTTTTTGPTSRSWSASPSFASTRAATRMPSSS